MLLMKEEQLSFYTNTNDLYVNIIVYNPAVSIVC